MTTITISGLPALLRELQRLSEAAQGRVARSMAGPAHAWVRSTPGRQPRSRPGSCGNPSRRGAGRKRVAKGQALAFANSSDWGTNVSHTAAGHMTIGLLE
jgi:hypothetical protein